MLTTWWFRKALVHKNCISVTVETTAQLGATWEIIRPLAAPSLNYVYGIGVRFRLSILLSDLRDIEGDMAEGRKTLPLVLGEANVRLFASVLFAALGGLMHFGFPSRNTHLIAKMYNWFVLGYHGLIFYRVITDKTRSDDRKAYMIYSFLYCFVLMQGLAYF